MTMRDNFMRWIEPLKLKVAVMLLRGVITNTNDSKQLQHVQVTLNQDEIRNDVEFFQQYGFTSRPKEGAEAIAISLGGHQDHMVIIAVEDRQYRIKAKEKGEVALYTDEGDFIHFKRGKIIEINTDTLIINAGAKVEVNTPAIELNGTSTIETNSVATTINTTTLAINKV